MTGSDILTTGEREALIGAFAPAAMMAASSPPPESVLLATQPRRRYDRFGCRLPVVMEIDGRTFPATAIDISLGGLRVEAGIDVPRCGSASCRVRLPAPVKVIEVRGEICWSGDRGDDAARGFSIDAIRPEDVVALMTFLDLRGRNDDHHPPSLKDAG